MGRSPKDLTPARPSRPIEAVSVTCASRGLCSCVPAPDYLAGPVGFKTVPAAHLCPTRRPAARAEGTALVLAPRCGSGRWNACWGLRKKPGAGTYCGPSAKPLARPGRHAAGYGSRFPPRRTLRCVFPHASNQMKLRFERMSPSVIVPLAIQMFLEFRPPRPNPALLHVLPPSGSRSGITLGSARCPVTRLEALTGKCPFARS